MRDSGFSILESLVAATIFSLTAIAILNVYTSSTQSINNLREKYIQIEVARSIIEEYLVRYPDIVRTGTLGTEYMWVVSEQEHPVTEPSRFDGIVKVMDVTVSVNKIGRTASASALTQSVLRRR